MNGFNDPTAVLLRLVRFFCYSDVRFRQARHARRGGIACARGVLTYPLHRGLA